MTSVLDCLPGVPSFESPLFNKIIEEKPLPPATLKIAQDLRRDGFAVFDLPDPEFDRKTAAIIRNLDKQVDWNGWRKGTTPNLRIQDA